MIEIAAAMVQASLLGCPIAVSTEGLSDSERFRYCLWVREWVRWIDRREMN